jgi:sugar O-acyltransferase (sialic acid O-acetyltransferase NeuD family)
MTSKLRLVIVGGRPDGHGKVAIETARETPGLVVEGFLDDAPKAANVAGAPCLGHAADWPRLAAQGVAFLVAIGDNAIRGRLANEIVAGGGQLTAIVHPRSVVAPSATVGDGTLVCAGAVVCAAARVGRNCIVNHGVVIEHDSVLEDHVNLSTGTVTGGRVTFGEGVFAGVGVRVIPDVRVGAWCYLGAGAVVIADTEPGCLYLGVPARRVRVLAT